MLIFAVMRTSDDSSEPPAVPSIPTSSTPSSTYTTSSTTTTTYTTPSPQTTEQNLPAPGPAPSTDVTTTEDTPNSGTVTETATLLPTPP